MANYNILEKFLNIQETTMFSKSIKLDFAKIIYNDTDTTPFWNYALTPRPLDKNEIATVAKKLESLNRKSAFYFENADLFVPFIDALKNDGYQMNNDDSWMFYEGKTVQTIGFNKVKRVESIEDLKIWLSTFDKCYQENDPQNPYGELGSYVDLARHAWERNNAVGKFEYFTAYNKNTPVAVATLTREKDLEYISNIGSLQDVRGQGYGKLITLFCIHQAQKRDSKHICLATEEGTYPNEFYKKLGFKTRFTAQCYVKDNAS